MNQQNSSKIGVVLGQLGTPDAPTAKALRPYLRQFLSDRRVIDYSPFLWQPLLRGIILRTRPQKSAKLYARIWLEGGSPLLVYSQQQVVALQACLGDSFRVILGMRYGNPSIPSAIATLEAEGIDCIVVLPMFPQFSCTTTASIYDAVYGAVMGKLSDRKRFMPTIRMIPPYYDHPAYIHALKTHLTAQIAQADTPPDKIIISFHGIPNRYIRTGDPYRAHCERTAQLLAEAMAWDSDQWQIAFQSQFGPEKWLEPYTDKVLEGLHHAGIKHPMIFSPGFVTDCLETLDELGNEGREQFAEGGGNPDHFRFIPCLNLNPAWIEAMGQLIRDHSTHL
ncbi:MAG: ferrochelatase [bacterium]|nr:ferrochelatase [bacterium]